jgi:Uma2 family endonuclease
MTGHVKPLPVEARRMTLEQWERLAEDDATELVSGLAEEGEMPSYIHETTLVWLMGVLLPWCRAHHARVVSSGLKYAISPQTGRMPDLSVFLREDARPPAQGLVRTPPSIMVEIVSPNPSDARRDRIQKLTDYAAFGVKWYWIVDPELRSFEILELNDAGRYVHMIHVTGTTLEHVPGCPALSLDVDQLWTELDEVMAEARS